jgi:hypothetical protein
LGIPQFDRCLVVGLQKGVSFKHGVLAFAGVFHGVHGNVGVT